MHSHARRHSAVSCAKMAEPIEMPLPWVVGSGGSKEPCSRWVLCFVNVENNTNKIQMSPFIHVSPANVPMTILVVQDSRYVTSLNFGK